MGRRRTVVHLPEELVTQILLWLPVKSLLRFKSVCKSWQSLIDGSQFVTEHHERSKEYLLVRTCDIASYKTTFSLLCRRTQSVIIPELDTSYMQSKHQLSINLSGPCNGVICLKLKDTEFVLWNPATRKIKTLPIPGELLFSTSREMAFWYWTPEFGFDSKSNDYKVVNLCVAHLHRNGQYVVYAQVYRLSCNSWRLLNASPQPLKKVARTSIHINGMLVFLAEGTGDIGLMVMAFDFSDETTTTTLFPDSYNKVSTGGNPLIRSRFIYIDAMNLFVLDARIALINHLREGCYEIWVLNEIGNKESWTKLYKFGPCSNLNLPLGDLKHHQLFVQSEGGELIWANPIDPTVKHLRRKTEEDFELKLHSQAFEYKESLVCLD